MLGSVQTWTKGAREAIFNNDQREIKYFQRAAFLAFVEAKLAKGSNVPDIGSLTTTRFSGLWNIPNSECCLVLPLVERKDDKRQEEST